MHESVAAEYVPNCMSPIRLLFPFGIAAALILGIEVVIGVVGTPSLYNTDFFDFSPMKPDVMQKHVIYDKNEIVLRDVPTTAIQVGDSSGFYGVIPAEVTAAANGMSYLNMSCCGDTGWEGYYYEAVLAMRRSPTPKLLVLHITPFWGPLDPQFRGRNGLATLIGDYLVQETSWHRVRPPSGGYRLRLTNLAYAGVWLDDFVYDAHVEQPKYPTRSKWRDMFEQNRGWVPLPWAMDDAYLLAATVQSCTIAATYSESAWLGLAEDDGLYRYLARFADLAQRHDARFVLVTNPVPCVVRHDAVDADIERQVAKFRRDYPDAMVPFRFLREAKRRDFQDRWHLNPTGAAEHSRLVGAALLRR